MSEVESEPVACSLSGTDYAHRGERWRRLSARAGLGVTRTTDGLSLAFSDLPGVRNELADLARLERECCPFADWALGQDGGTVSLAVHGHGEQGVIAVHDMFDAFSTASAPNR